MKRLKKMKFAYVATHDPPPLHTTGTRALNINESYEVGGRRTTQKRRASMDNIYSKEIGDNLQSNEEDIYSFNYDDDDDDEYDGVEIMSSDGAQVNFNTNTSHNTVRL
uniref:E3 ubiquitin-protein ligase UPL3 n=1 Tax=Lygus hesperus TaxID=30085 RepID=A0A0A9WL46_LYGHE